MKIVGFLSKFQYNHFKVSVNQEINIDSDLGLGLIRLQPITWTNDGSI